MKKWNLSHLILIISCKQWQKDTFRQIYFFCEKREKYHCHSIVKGLDNLSWPRDLVTLTNMELNLVNYLGIGHNFL